MKSVNITNELHDQVKRVCKEHKIRITAFATEAIETKLRSSEARVITIRGETIKKYLAKSK